MNMTELRLFLRRKIGLCWNLKNVLRDPSYRSREKRNQRYLECLKDYFLDFSTCSTKGCITKSQMIFSTIIQSMRPKSEIIDILKSISASVKVFQRPGFTLGIFGMFHSPRDTSMYDLISFQHPHNFIAEIAKNTGPAVAFVEIKGEHHKSGKRVTLANGSGFIVSSNGLLLTNAHVVENKSHVTVKLHDGSEFEGLVTVVDPVSDLAVIKIKTDKALPVIPLGKSAHIRPGEFVAAMGSPLSLHKTITYGIVSSPLRDSGELGLNNKMNYIQTDATIGLGNSGGPLVNMDGEAIGINQLKLTEGISFAIPSDYAIPVIQKAQDLVAREAKLSKPSYFLNGRESKKRRYLGITMLSLTESLILELKDKQREFPDIKSGVYVYKVVVSSPAYVGGLHAGDVIVAINGESMESSGDVYSMVETVDKLRVKVLRGKHFETLNIKTESI